MSDRGADSSASATDIHGRRVGLSDLAVSPFGLPLALHGKEVRVAWVGRTSTEDHQDPRQSLLCQLERSKVSLPATWVIVCHFYDVESGRMEIHKRGRGTDYERFDIPIARDGGITDLLAEAPRPARRFDVVICESMSRIARKMYENLSVERELERAEVPVFASNELIMLTGGCAQQILQRRINQSVAEYEVLNMLELSWGWHVHTRSGGLQHRQAALRVQGEEASSSQREQGRQGLDEDPARTGRVARRDRHVDREVASPRAVGARHHRRPPQPGPRQASPIRTHWWSTRSERVVEDHRGGHPEEPEVHRVPGLQPPGTA
jgi:hypothetical protein